MCTWNWIWFKKPGPKVLWIWKKCDRTRIEGFKFLEELDSNPLPREIFKCQNWINQNPKLGFCFFTSAELVGVYPGCSSSGFKVQILEELDSNPHPSNGYVTLRALPFTIEKYLKSKEELWKLKKLFHHAKNIIFKKSSKRNQNPSRDYNSIRNLKFQHKAKISFFFKSSY